MLSKYIINLKLLDVFQHKSHPTYTLTHCMSRHQDPIVCWTFVKGTSHQVFQSFERQWSIKEVLTQFVHFNRAVFEYIHFCIHFTQFLDDNSKSIKITY